LKDFPLIIEANLNASDIERSNLLELATRYGVILLDGLSLETAEDFDQFIQTFRLPNFPYEKSLSNAVRVNRTERVFTANEAPPETFIPLHHEMAQTPFYPTWLFFFCEKAPESGGATPVCHSGALWNKLQAALPTFARNCEKHGLRYSNVMPGENDAGSGLGRSWRSTFSVESREDAESRMNELGYSWEWLADDSLRATTPTLPAVLETIPGQKTFFNQLIAVFYGWKDARNDPSKSITLGNGDPIDPEDIHKTTELAESCTFDVQWKEGQVALVDNRIAMHGRKPFEGTRKVLASMS